MRHVAAAVGVVGFAVCLARPARAEETAHDKAIAAFQEGRKYIEAGNCDAAVAKLTESLQHEPTVGARISIAECWEKSDPLGAWRMLKEAALQALTRGDDRLPVIELRAAGLEKRLPLIRVSIPHAVVEEAGFELRVDGELMDRYWYRNGVIATKPGRHLVEASTPHRKFSQTISVEPNGGTNVSVVMQREAIGGSAAVVTTDAPGSGRRTLGLTIAGVGIVGLAAGTVFGILTLDKKSKLEDACGGNTGVCQAPAGSLDAERESAQTTGAISTASFIVGSAALLGGAAIYFTAPSSTTTGVRVGPSVARGGGGLSVGGSW
jgi:hypothetical protein